MSTIIILFDGIGAGFGLSLTLNIEQYEYIQGPVTDAGIKVTLNIKNIKATEQT